MCTQMHCAAHAHMQMYYIYTSNIAAGLNSLSKATWGGGGVLELIQGMSERSIAWSFYHLTSIHLT